MSAAASPIATAGTTESAKLPRGFGDHEPRICWVPEHDHTVGPRAIAFCKEVGLTLDPWQEAILGASLNEAGDHWAAREVGVVCPRQNGKNEILLARQLVGLYLLNERLIVHSAHQWDTSMEAFQRLRDVIEDSPKLMRSVARKGISTSHGSEGITLENGQRIRFRTRTGGGGRGFSIDCFMFDESMYLAEMFYAALRPTLLARPTTQIWLTGSAVDKEVHEHGIVLARMRERGIAKEDEVAYFEYSMEGENPDLVPDKLLEDEAELRKANPALGSRIDIKNLLSAKRSMSARGFKVECGGIGDWPRTDGLDNVVITPEEWAKWLDKASTISGSICLSVDVGPDRHRSAIAACGLRSDEKLHVEVLERKRDTVGLADYVLKIIEDHTVLAVIVDGRSPANSLVPELTEKLPVGELHDREITVLSATEHAQACGMLYDAGQQNRLRHIGQPELADALRGAIKRPLTDAWAWHRINSTVDISPLVACTLALYGAEVFQPGEPKFWDLSDFEEAA